MGGERERERDLVRVGGSPVHCPYCKGEIEDLKSVVACAACGARHHEGCHDTHGACATCGSREKLVPAAPRKRSRGDPLPGSKIRVERRGDATEYIWQPGTPGDLAVAVTFALLVLALPLAVYIFLAYLRAKPRTIRVTPEAIEFPVIGPAGVFGRTKTVVARRQDVGRIQTLPGPFLGIDVGIARHLLGASIFVPTLMAPELEWLADQLDAWKDSGR